MSGHGRVLWPIMAAFLVSQIGNWAFRASVLYEIYRSQDADRTVLGALVILIYVPILLGSRFLAPLADRFSSKPLLIGLDAARACLLLPLLVLHDLRWQQNAIVAMAVVTLLALGSPLFTAAQSAYIRRVVDEDEVRNALAVISNIEWFTYVVGTVAGALLLVAVEFRGIVAIDILTFVVSLVTLACFMKRETVTATAHGIHAAVGEHVNARRADLSFLVAIFLLNLGAGVINVYPTVVASDIFGSGGAGLSQIYLGNGIAGFLGALVVQRIGKDRQPLRLLLLASGLVTVSLLGMSVLVAPLIAVATSSAMLFFGQIFGIVANTHILKLYPVSEAGRAAGRFMAATFAGVAVNAALFAFLPFTWGQDAFTIFLLGCAAASGASVAVLFGRQMLVRHGSGSRAAVPAEVA
jgi:predicted MFS family arabinose efflux permease